MKQSIFEASEALQKWEGMILQETRLFNSEVEATWASLIGWTHKTSKLCTSFCHLQPKKNPFFWLIVFHMIFEQKLEIPTIVLQEPQILLVWLPYYYLYLLEWRFFPYVHCILQLNNTYIHLQFRCLLTKIADSKPANVIFGKSRSFFWIS